MASLSCVAFTFLKKVVGLPVEKVVGNVPVLLDEKRLGQIERDTSVTALPDIAAYLQGTLGQKLTAYISGLTDPKEVGHWIKGTADPRTPADIKLRYAYHATRLIVESYGPDTAKAWLFGTNTRLRDEAPAYLIRHAKSIDDLRDLIPVSRAFAGSVE